MTRPISPFSLAYSLLAGPVLWFMHFVAVYILAEFGCRINFSNMTFMTPASIRQWVTVLTLVALIPVMIGGVQAYRNWRQFPAGDQSSPIDARLHFLLVIGVILSVFFVFNILVTAMPAFFVQACDSAA